MPNAGRRRSPKSTVPAKPSAEDRKRALKVVRLLEKAYPDAECALKHGDAFQLLVATILSAQCTDAMVNKVTPILFSKYRSPEELGAAELGDVEAIIHPTGFFRAKSKNIVAMSRALAEQHESEVPQRLEALTALPGVGRKTANVVLGTAFGLATGVVVDTHVKRLSYRLGLTKSTDPLVIERDLMALLPKKHWVMFSHRLIWHGRKICIAARPKCDQCVLDPVCPKVGVKPR